MRQLFLNRTAVFIAGGLLALCFLGCHSERPGRSLESGLEGPGWSDLKMWYRQPAEQWIEALPVGNGRLGAMVYGRLTEEIIQLNEDTIWSGGPYQPSEPEGPEELAEVRRLVFEGKFRKAEEIFGRIMNTAPRGHQKYQPLGILGLEFPGNGPVENYRRELDLDTAVAAVSYRRDGIEFRREIFVSPVDQVIVVRMTANAPGQITCRIGIAGVHNTPPRDEFFTVEAAAPDTLILQGRTASYRGVEGRVRFQARVRVIPEGGTISAGESGISVNTADALNLLIPAATNFVSYKDISGDPEARVTAALAAAVGKSYDRLRADHVTEHRRLFRRVNIDLGTTARAELPTDERLQMFTDGSDPQLAALYFQFGRYLLISSSRPGTRPPHLQGIWNEDMNPSWDSKYTTNINLEMNYWPAEAANLAECVEPLVEMVEGLAETGRRTAKLHYGASGWVHHFNTDIWLPTAPMGGGRFGTWHTGGAWLCTHLWDHYLFGGDESFLHRIYPVLKDAAQFFLDTLVEHPQYAWLVTNPSNSPENNYRIAGNRTTGFDHTTICAGPTMDMQIIRDLFDSCIQASGILGIDGDFSRTLRETRRRLAPMQVGRHGQLQEWLEDWDDPLHKHRHLSHLYGLYPSDQITLRGDPVAAAAARQSLLQRGDKNMGWSRGWKINLWARLEDGERAFQLLCSQLDLQFNELRQHDDEGYWKGGVYPNMFSCGPPRQVDGVFSGCSGIAEMLLQSHSEEIYLLPALPEAWSEGSVTGLRARSGFEVDMEWANGRLIQATIRSKLGRPCRVRAKTMLLVEADGFPVQTAYPIEVVPYGMKKGTVKPTRLTEFETEAGGVYTLRFRIEAET